MFIDGREISLKKPPYVIAEISANHNGSIETAKKLIQIAKESGASAVKLQTYTPDTITLDSDQDDFRIKEGLWKGSTLYQLYESAYTPWDWQPELFRYAKEVGITIFSSPFDTTAVDFLESLDAPAYKIASFEAIDTPLIKYAASTKKPLIISTGLANKDEISEAIETAREAGCEDLAILHCVSSYPAKPEDYNLNTIVDMRSSFDVEVGLSDHTLTNNASVTAIALGASIVEKHITLDRHGGGPDDSFSLEPNDLNGLCADLREAWSALGTVNYGIKEGERPNLKFRRSLYFVRDLEAGQIIDSNAVRSIRPGFGLSPKHLGRIVGKTTTRKISRGTACSWDLIVD